MTAILNYEKLKESDEENRYSFEADYPQIAPAETPTPSEINLLIEAFVTQVLQRFRSQAVERAAEKNKELKLRPHSKLMWDDLYISHEVSLFNDEILSLEFRLTSYYAFAAHPNHQTRTLNFRFRPTPLLLKLDDLFLPNSNYLTFLSEYCVIALREQLPHQLNEGYSNTEDSWIWKGAGPQQRNFENFLLTKEGLRIIFDEYQVGSYADGRREVVVPIVVIGPMLKQQFGELASPRTE